MISSLRRVLTRLQPGGIAAFRDYNAHHQLKATVSSSSLDALKSGLAALFALTPEVRGAEQALRLHGRRWLGFSNCPHRRNNGRRP
jgi:hypothetical protein